MSRTRPSDSRPAVLWPLLHVRSLYIWNAVLNGTPVATSPMDLGEQNQNSHESVRSRTWTIYGFLAIIAERAACRIGSISTMTE